MRLEQHLLLEDERTDFLESAALIGISCKKGLISKINSFLKAKENPNEMIEHIKREIHGGYDWNARGVSYIQDIDPTTDKGLSDIIDVCALARGMYKFRDKIASKLLKGKIYFIHDKINDYYKLEKKKVGEIKGSKENTADCVLCTLPASQTFSVIEDGQLVENGKMINVINNKGKVVCSMIAVSLKKSADAAQLGKIKKFLSQNLGLGPAGGMEAAKELIDSNLIKSYTTHFEYLNEGIIDKIRSITSNIWSSFLTAIKNLMTKFVSSFQKIIGKEPPKKYINQFMSDMGVNESTINEKSVQGIEKIKSKPAQKVIVSIIQNQSKALNTLTKNLKILENIVVKKDLLNGYFKYSGVKKLDKNNAIQESLYIIGNYCTVQLLIDFIKKTKDVSKTVRRLIAETLFGGTKLPLWKVYGDYKDTGHSYEYLGTIARFLDKGDAKDVKLEILGIRVNPQTSYYNITVMMLYDVTDKQKVYAIFRTGTNSSSSITFNFEGSTTRTFDINEPFKNIIKGRGK